MQTPIASTAALVLLATVAPALAEDGRDASPEAQTSEAAASDRPLSAMPSYRTPAVPWNSYEDAQAEDTVCQDRIFRAREESGQPPLGDSPTEADPLMIWAVDRREDGCAVLVAKGDPDDIRPIPKVEDGYILRPAG